MERITFQNEENGYTVAKVIPRGKTGEVTVVGELTGADKITESSIWVGCGPTLTDAMVDWIAEAVVGFLQR